MHVVELKKSKEAQMTIIDAVTTEILEHLPSLSRDNLASIYESCRLLLDLDEHDPELDAAP